MYKILKMYKSFFLIYARASARQTVKKYIIYFQKTLELMFTQAYTTSRVKKGHRPDRGDPDTRRRPPKGGRGQPRQDGRPTRPRNRRQANRRDREQPTPPTPPTPPTDTDDTRPCSTYQQDDERRPPQGGRTRTAPAYARPERRATDTPQGATRQGTRTTGRTDRTTGRQDGHGQTTPQGGQERPRPATANSDDGRKPTQQATTPTPKAPLHSNGKPLHTPPPFPLDATDGDTRKGDDDTGNGETGRQDDGHPARLTRRATPARVDRDDRTDTRKGGRLATPTDGV